MLQLPFKDLAMEAIGEFLEATLISMVEAAVLLFQGIIELIVFCHTSAV